MKLFLLQSSLTRFDRLCPTTREDFNCLLFLICERYERFKVEAAKKKYFPSWYGSQFQCVVFFHECALFLPTWKLNIYLFCTFSYARWKKCERTKLPWRDSSNSVKLGSKLNFFKGTRFLSFFSSCGDYRLFFLTTSRNRHDHKTARWSKSFSLAPLFAFFFFSSALFGSSPRISRRDAKKLLLPT